jgi:hypothetical protein
LVSVAFPLSLLVLVVDIVPGAVIVAIVIRCMLYAVCRIILDPTVDFGLA